MSVYRTIGPTLVYIYLNDHGTLQNFPFFFTVVPALSVCIFVQNFINILKLMLMKEHLYWNTSVKFDK